MGNKKIKKSDKPLVNKPENESTTRINPYPENDSRPLTTPDGQRLEIVLVPIKDIKTSAYLRVRDLPWEEQIKFFERLIRDKEGSGFYVDLFEIENALILADGEDILTAFKRTKAENIPAVIHRGSLQDAFLYRVGVNARNGRSLNMKERQRAALKILSDPELGIRPDREIARICNISPGSVRKLRNSAASSTNNSQIRIVSRNGKQYPMQTSQIGKQSKPSADDLESSSDETVNTVSNFEDSDEAYSPEVEVITSDENFFDGMEFEDDFSEDTSNKSIAASNKPKKPDLAAELQKKYRVKNNEAFIILSKSTPGKFHLLINGDSSDPNIFNRTFAAYPEKCGYMNSDFIYNANYDSSYRDNQLSNSSSKLKNDKLSVSEYEFLIENILKNCDENLEDGSAYTFFYGFGVTVPTYTVAGRILGIPRRLIVWKKRKFVQSRSKDFRWGQECAIYGFKSDALRYWGGKLDETTMFDENHFPKTNHELPLGMHPSPKPVAIIAKMIKLLLEPGKSLIDPMSGSGTALVASELTGRLSVCMDIDAAFIAVTLYRVERLQLKFIRVPLKNLSRKLTSLRRRGIIN